MMATRENNTRRERLVALDQRLFEREVYAWSGSREEDILRQRHVQVRRALRQEKKGTR